MMSLLIDAVLGTSTVIFSISFNQRPLSIQLKKSERTEKSAKIFLSACAFSTRLCNIRTQSRKSWRWKSWKFSTFLADFLDWNFNSQWDFVLISKTFFNIGSRNKTPLEIYQGFSDYVIWNFLFQREFYQPGWVQDELPQRCFVKKVFLEISQNSQENTCVKVCFSIKLKTYVFS